MAPTISEPHDPDCIFCRIATGHAPAEIVHEDDATVAFLDIRPSSPGHTLVICRAHHDNLYDVSAEALAAVAATSQRLARAIHGALQPDGLRVAQFNGAAAGQTVFHYHVHLVPVNQGQGRGIHGREAADPTALKDVGARIRAALQS